MKPLSEEQQEKIWNEITKGMTSMSQPKEGERTVEQFAKDIDYGYSLGQLRRKLNRLVAEEILGKRKIVIDGNTTNVYFPVIEVSAEEISELLTE